MSYRLPFKVAYSFVLNKCIVSECILEQIVLTNCSVAYLCLVSIEAHILPSGAHCCFGRMREIRPFIQSSSKKIDVFLSYGNFLCYSVLLCRILSCDLADTDSLMRRII